MGNVKSNQKELLKDTILNTREITVSMFWCHFVMINTYTFNGNAEMIKEIEQTSEVNLTTSFLEWTEVMKAKISHRLMKKKDASRW